MAYLNARAVLFRYRMAEVRAGVLVSPVLGSRISTCVIRLCLIAQYDCELQVGIASVCLANIFTLFFAAVRIYSPLPVVVSRLSFPYYFAAFRNFRYFVSVG